MKPDDVAVVNGLCEAVDAWDRDHRHYSQSEAELEVAIALDAYRNAGSPRVPDVPSAEAIDEFFAWRYGHEEIINMKHIEAVEAFLRAVKP